MAISSRRVPSLSSKKDLAASLYELNRFLASQDRWRVLLNAVPVADLPNQNLHAAVEFGKLIFTFWGEDFSQSWRIRRFKVTSSSLLLQLARMTQDQQVSVEIHSLIATDSERMDSSCRRQRFTERLVAALRSNLHAVEIEWAATGHGSPPGVSIVYSRAFLYAGNQHFAVIGAGEDESDETITQLLAAGLIWAQELSSSPADPPIRCLLVAPEGRSRTVARRMTVLRPEALSRLALYEICGVGDELKRVQPTDQGSLFDATKVRLPRALVNNPIQPTRLNALRALPVGARVYAGAATGVVSIRYRGLELGRITRGDCKINRLVARALGRSERKPSMQSIAETVAAVRKADGPDRWHPLYRLQTERWLEEMIRDDLNSIDPQLDPKMVYPQIPAHDDHERGMVDLLAIQQDGRLVILELKVQEDLQLPLQGIDYWLRVEWHRRRGDFERRGYFPGRAIAPAPALLYLVAPLFRFHRAFQCIASAVSPEIPIYRIGINEDWRGGIKVLRRERLNAMGEGS